MKRTGLIKAMGIAVISAAVLFGCGKDEEPVSANETSATETEARAEDGTEVEVKVETGEEAENGGAEAQEGAEGVSIKGIADSLRNDIAYQDELSEVDLETAGMFISFGDANIKDAVIYESTGATAEEIIVLECEGEEDAAKAKSSLETRVSEQKEAFKDYVPEELEKLSKAVVMTRGNIAVLSVSNEPDKAKEIIGK